MKIVIIEVIIKPVGVTKFGAWNLANLRETSVRKSLMLTTGFRIINTYIIERIWPVTSVSGYSKMAGILGA